jgi:hypothetical protein
VTSAMDRAGTSVPRVAWPLSWMSGPCMARAESWAPRGARPKSVKEAMRMLLGLGGLTASGGGWTTSLCSVGSLIAWADDRTISFYSGGGLTTWAGGRTTSLCSWGWSDRLVSRLDRQPLFEGNLIIWACGLTASCSQQWEPYGNVRHR